ncbi:MAG: hypothetical protein SPI86_01610 [Treponemataceae bacterium]|nr:hypothetical protein [Treponemataceae bacterium]
MKIITIFGDENVGKTTLVWDVFNKLMETGAELTYFHVFGADGRDFHAIVVWEGKIIAICSIGDVAYEEDIKDSGISEDEKSFLYVKNGIDMARKYKAEILLNVVSNSIKEKCPDIKEKYEELLKDDNQKNEVLSTVLFERKSTDLIEVAIKKRQECRNAIIKDLRNFSVGG